MSFAFPFWTGKTKTCGRFFFCCSLSKMSTSDRMRFTFASVSTMMM